MRMTLLKRVGLLLSVVMLAGCQMQVTPQVGTTQTGAQPGGALPVGTAAPAGESPGAASQLATRTAAGATRNQGAAAIAATPVPATRAITTSQSVAVDGDLTLTAPMVTAAFESSGKVTSVRIAAGQPVKKGELLAELESADLTTALQKAEENLALKKAEIAQSVAPATKSELDSAKAALSQAQATYAALKKLPLATTIEQALRSWNQAKNSLYSAQLNRDVECGWQGKPEAEKIVTNDKDCKAADLSVKSAELREQTAARSYQDAKKPATAADLTKSWASVVQAQSSLAGLQNGASDEQKQIYTLQLQQAQLAVDRARRALDKTKLLAPCDCIVQDVTLAVGAPASGSITLFDPTQVRFRTTNLNERDVIKLKIGQPVTLRLRAFSTPFTGKLNAILPVSSGTLSGVALYEALIDVDSSNAKLLPGMTGSAEIILR